MNGIINADNARSSSISIKNEKLPYGNHKLIEFPVWCAKAITAIYGQDDTLTSHSIIISLRRKLAIEKVKQFRVNLFQHYEATPATLAAWADKFEAISKNEMETFFKANTDRSKDNRLAISASLLNELGLIGCSAFGLHSQQLKRVKAMICRV